METLLYKIRKLLNKGITPAVSFMEKNKFREIAAEYDDLKQFVIDKAGYFLIRLDRKKGNIEVGFCKERNKIALKITGKSR